MCSSEQIVPSTIVLNSVEHSKVELEPADSSKDKRINCTFESIFSIDLDKNVLGIRINNISESEVRLSKMLLELDSSYEIMYDNIVLPS